MRGQGEVQDLSAQNTISYVIKPDVLCYSFLHMGNSLKIGSTLNSMTKVFIPFQKGS